ncbi:MAG: HEAT repeat domain-containing protein [Phycisphaerae bacterium]|nr:HEAT repeat domain-containing protein [Phycisphaerae bacterium]
MRREMGKIGLLVFLAGLLGCEASTPVTGTIAQRLQAEDPDVRIQAAVEAGNTSDKDVIPLLVDRLSDTDRDVRFYAGQALERLVGSDVYKELGWVSYDPPERREKSVMRWRRWVRKHHGQTTTQPATTEPS